MRVIVAGSRTIHDMRLLETAIEESGFDITTVLCGGADGADDLGRKWATERQIPVEHYPAQWSVYGKGAGPIRNMTMARRAHALIALWDGRSRGTANMIEEAKSHHLNVFVKTIP